MSDSITEERFHFNSVAGLYDSARPGYSSLLIDDLICLSKTKEGASVLDIGCGTGKSTEPFAKRGYSVCALDPGIAMLELCKKNLQAYTNVKYEVGSFETWDWHGSPFDLVVSGTAFHWVPDAGHRRVRDVLQPQGAIAVFWQTFLNGPDPVYRTIEELYQRHAPEIQVEDFHGTQEVFDRKREQQVLSMVGFSQWRVIRYYEYLSYDAKRYVDLMRTWSTHRDVSETLFSEVGSAIGASGGEIVKPVRTTLCLAQKDVT
jgi:ubiquinone/menaquinone biosynthesis C-methylase UbiE